MLGRLNAVMKLRLLLPLTLGLLSGCQSHRATNNESPTLRPFAGSYYRGNGRYSISLDLSADGSYNAKGRGCLGSFGVARGSWAVLSDRIALSPTKETRGMKGHLKQFDIVRHDGHLILVQSDDRAFFDAQGV